LLHKRFPIAAVATARFKQPLVDKSDTCFRPLAHFLCLERGQISLIASMDVEGSSRGSVSQLQLVASSQAPKKSKQRGRKEDVTQTGNTKSKSAKPSVLLLLHSSFYQEYLREDMGDKLLLCTEECREKFTRYRTVDTLAMNVLLFSNQNCTPVPTDTAPQLNYAACEPFVLAMLPPAQLLEAVTTREAECEFRSLYTTMETLFAPTSGVANAKKILCVVGLDKQCVAYQRKVCGEIPWRHPDITNSPLASSSRATGVSVQAC
jgi:hypothetical protein